jgi:hypothetical protein
VHSSQLNQLAAANLQNPKKPFHDDFQMVKNPIWIHLENRENPHGFFHQLPPATHWIEAWPRFEAGRKAGPVTWMTWGKMTRSPWICWMVMDGLTWKIRKIQNG